MPVAALSADDAAAVARLLGSYTKAHNAGGFAHPLASELLKHPERVHWERVGSEQAVVVASQLRRASHRIDFTGAEFVIPQGSVVATHVARTPNLMPDLSSYDYVFAYATDPEMSMTLKALGKAVVASRVSSAAEVINVWGPLAQAVRYPDCDAATVVDLGLIAPDGLDQMRGEITTVTGWDDDFPYYSDGGWSAVCLKGFWPDQPGRGVKPSEMPRSWKAKHRGDLARRAEWTVLSAELPKLTEFVQSVPWWRRTERVRLLKMNAGSSLGRHTDITDRNGGTRDGQIVRFHVPVVTDPAVRMDVWELDGRRVSHHLAAGRCYYLDARKPHAVHNGSSVNRVHLVVDVVADADVRQCITEGYRGQARLK